MKTRKQQIQEQVTEFHKQHPEVWSAFEHFTTLLIKRGHRHYSADAVMHVVRFQTDVNPNRDHGYLRLNNNYVSFYARRWQRLHPDYADFFRTRRQISADKIIQP